MCGFPLEKAMLFADNVAGRVSVNIAVIIPQASLFEII